MKIKTFLMIYAALSTSWGIGWLLLSETIFSLYGMQGSEELKYTGQLFGALLISFGVLAWMIRNAPSSQLRRSIILALFLGEAIGLVITLSGQIGGVVNVMGWSTVYIYLFFTLGLGYFVFLDSFKREAGTTKTI